MNYGPNTDASGGTRYSQGKPGGWWFAPLHGLKLIAPVWEAGGAKYAPMDWKAGQSFSTLFDCMMRHLIEVQHHGIWSRDPDLGTYHLANACWNLLCLLTFMALDRHDLDDITPYEGVTAAEYHDAEEASELAGAPVHLILRDRVARKVWEREPSYLEPEVVTALNALPTEHLREATADYQGDGENAHNEGDAI